MSSEAVIQVSGLAKAYFIYEKPSDRLRQAVVPRIRSALRPLARRLGASIGERCYFRSHWALKAASFSVHRGESVAVIGRNGSGKSTLLKLVCGTVAPTEGEVKVHGRVAALLELGLGFNPEFTGRENVFLNASILGMTREESEARLDDILSFADIGEFVDQPVKTYSTGMAMRLAFAVMVHVDADILVVDEALAVGDAYFQQKCMRWLRQFREQGTLLFCGHDTGAVMALCERAIWLDRGEMMMEGSAKAVCEAYSASIMSQAAGLPERVVRIARPRMAKVAAAAPDAVAAGSGEIPASRATPPGAGGASDPGAPGEAAGGATRAQLLPPPPQAGGPVIFSVLAQSTDFGSGDAEIVDVTMTRPDGSPLTWIEGGEQVLIAARVAIHVDVDAPIAGFIIKDRLGQPLMGDNTFNQYASCPLSCAAGDEVQARFGFQMPFLGTGRYSVTVAFASGTLDNNIQHHWLHDAIMFDVQSPFRNGVIFAVEMNDLSLSVMTPTMTR